MKVLIIYWLLQNRGCIKLSLPNAVAPRDLSLLLL